METLFAYSEYQLKSYITIVIKFSLETYCYRVFIIQIWKCMY